MSINYYQKSVALLGELQKRYPSYNMGKHLATAFVDYPDMWGIPDRVFHSTLLNYMIELELDFSHREDDLDKIINEGLNLSSCLEDEEEED
jgi:hypothetical protein